MVHHALGTGEYRVVVADHHAACLDVREQMAVDRADAGYQAVGRTGFDQLFQRTATALRGDRQRAIFDKTFGIAQVDNVFARGALAGFAAARDRIGPRIVQPDCVALPHFGQIVTLVIEIAHWIRFDPRIALLRRLDEHDRVAFEQDVAWCDRNQAHDAARCRLDDVLHLHRLDHRHLLAGLHHVAFTHVDRHHRALHRRGERYRMLGRDRAGGGRLVIAGFGGDPIEIQFLVDVILRSHELADILLDETRMHAVGGHVRMPQQVLQEADVGRDAFDPEFA